MSRSRVVLGARKAAAGYRRCAAIAHRDGDDDAAADYEQFADEQDQRADQAAHGARRDPRDRKD